MTRPVTPAIHGPDHDPLYGPDPFGPPPFQAYFEYNLLTNPTSITSPDTWTTVTMSRAYRQNVDFFHGGQCMLLDGSAGVSGSGTSFTFNEPVDIPPTDSDVWTLWLIGMKVTWDLGGVVVDNLESDTDQEVACRMLAILTSKVPLLSAKRAHPSVSGSLFAVNTLGIVDDVNLTTEAVAWLDAGDELSMREDWDDGAGADKLRLQVRHTVTKETGSGDVKVIGASFWGIRQYRGPRP